MKTKIFRHLKKLTAVFLSAVMIFCGMDLSAAAGSYFNGTVVTDESGIPLGGISIEIYGSRLKYSANGLKRYVHYYSGTVETDEYGRFSFLRPSTKTLLKVDLGTLPEGVGVDSLTRLVGSKYSDTFRLSRPEEIEVIPSDNGSVYNVRFIASDGSAVYTEHEVTESVSASFMDLTYEKINDLELYRTVNVRTSDLSDSSTFPLDISHYTIPGRLALLVSLGIIDEQTRRKIIADYNTDTATNDEYIPEYYNERTFIAGNFVLHSEQSTQNIEQYESILSDIVDVYFNKYGFLEPYHEFVKGSKTERDPLFHIYMSDPDAIRIDSAVAPKNIVGKTVRVNGSDVTKGGFIVISPSEAVSFKKTLSHEIFHGIIYRYAKKNPPEWFKEAFANYGALLCLNGSVKSLNKQMGYYLNSPEFPLNNTAAYKYRHYGVTLLPLYIHNKLGGADTIKNILKAYENSSDALKAIDSGLKATKSSYGFASLFAGFKDMNAYTKFYKIPDTSVGNKSINIGKNAVRTSTFSFDEADTFSTPDMTLVGNSASYFEFRAPEDSSGTFTLTVDTSGGITDASYNLILKGKKTVIPKRGKMYELMTFVISDFGGAVDTAVLTAGNTSISVDSRVDFIAGAYFKES